MVGFSPLPPPLPPLSPLFFSSSLSSFMAHRLVGRHVKIASFLPLAAVAVFAFFTKLKLSFNTITFRFARHPRVEFLAEHVADTLALRILALSPGAQGSFGREMY